MSKTYKVVYNACFGGFGLSTKAIARLTELGVVHESEYDYSYHMARHDPLLVQVVEELGDEASAKYAKLRIAEITSPLYQIDEYDGSESVMTPEDMSWVKIE